MENLKVIPNFLSHPQILSFIVSLFPQQLLLFNPRALVAYLTLSVMILENTSKGNFPSFLGKLGSMINREVSREYLKT